MTKTNKMTNTIPNISSAAYVIPGIKNIKLVLQKGGIDLFFSIRDKVCTFYNVDVNLLWRKTRVREVSLCRQVIAYLGRENTTLSLKVMGYEFKRDHTTVMNMIAKMRNDIETDEVTRKEVEYIRSIL